MSDEMDVMKAALEELVEMERFSLRRLQEELRPWVTYNFGDRESWQPLLGALEELGELAHAHLKAHQHIRGTEAVHAARAQDAVADCVIFLADYCNARGWDMEKLLAQTWADVRQRDWVRQRAAEKAKEEEKHA